MKIFSAKLIVFASAILFTNGINAQQNSKLTQFVDPIIGSATGMFLLAQMFLSERYNLVQTILWKAGIGAAVTTT